MSNETHHSDVTTMDPPDGQPAAVAALHERTADGPSPIATQEVPLQAICLDSDLQVRQKPDPHRVKNYAQLMEDGVAFPPVVIFRDGETLWLADGKHRVLAAIRNACETIRADVRPGTERDAYLYGLQSNAAHGLPLTNAEKGVAVDRMLHDAEWSQWSDREIARQCGVTHPFVGKRRQRMTGNDYQSPARKVTRGAKIIMMNTARIGHRTSAAPPSEAITDAAPQGAADPATADHPHETGQNHQAPLAPPAHDPRSASDPQAGEGTPLHHEAEPDRGLSRERDGQEARPAGTPNGEPKAADCQPASEIGGSDGLPEAPASRAPDPELHLLLETLAGHLSDFRAQHAGAEPVVDEVLALLEGAIQQARHTLEETSPHLERDVAALDTEESVLLEQEETPTPDDPELRGDASSLEASPATAERSGVVATVQAFVAKRCVPSDEPTSSDALMAAIQTWLDNQGEPPLTDPNAVCDALHRLGFKDEAVGMQDGRGVHSGWQWQDLQLLPADAPDNPVDPFQDSRPVSSTEV